MVAQVLSIQARIDASRKAAAFDRAWNVAKSLEGTEQIRGLTWVKPEQDPKSGIRRRVDFGNYHVGVSTLPPTPLSIDVLVPGNKVAPGENMQTAWTMPLLMRTCTCTRLPQTIQHQFPSDLRLRPTIEIVSFLPVPRAGAPAEEQFTTEFLIRLQVDSRHVPYGTQYGALALFGGKTARQLVLEGFPGLLAVVADPCTQTLFSAQALPGLSVAELAATPANAGQIDVFLYRLTNASPINDDILRMLDGILRLLRMALAANPYPL